MDLERRGSVRCAFLDSGQRKSDLPHGVEVERASEHWSVRFPRTCSSLARYRHEYATTSGRGCDYPREPEPLQDSEVTCPSAMVVTKGRKIEL